MMTVKYAMQVQRNYEMFKQAIGLLCETKELTEEEENYLYLKAKAELYNLDWDYSIYDPIGLQQALEEHEWIEKKDSYNQDRDYYNSLGVTR